MPALLESAEPPGPRALVEAAASGQTGTVRALLREGADVNDKDADGLTALAAAAANGHVATVLSLILLGANPENPDTLGRTPLMLAAENGQAAVIRALYDFEAALGLVRRETENDPDNALPKLRERITGVDVRLFDQIGARLPDFRVNTSAQNRSGQSAFMKAAARGHTECGLALLGWKDGPLQDKEGRTAAMLAALNGQADFIRAMIRNPTTNQGTGNGTTLTYHAMLAPEVLALTDINGQTAIALAETHGHGEIADLLRGELRAIIDHCSAVLAAEGAFTPRSALEIREAAQSALGEPVGEGDKPPAKSESSL